MLLFPMTKKTIENRHRKTVENNLIDKVLISGSKAGKILVIKSLTLFYAYKREDTPMWAKKAILGALVYFISPIDGIPDIIPFSGYLDDFAIVLVALFTVSRFVTDDEIKKANQLLFKLFNSEK